MTMMLDLVTGAIDTAVSTVSTTQALAMLLMTCMAVYWFNNSKNKMKLPPGPSGYPLVGNVLEFIGQPLHSKSAQWKEKYGPVMSFRIGPQRVIVLNTIEALTEAFVQRATDFAGKSLTPSGAYLSGGGADIALADYGQDLKYRRKIAMLAIRQYLTGDQHTKRIHSVVCETVESLRGRTEPLDPHLYFPHIFFNIMHGICFGYTMKSDDPTYKELIKNFDNSIGNITGFWEDFFPVLQHFPTRAFRQFKKEVDIFMDYILGHVKRRREVFDENKIENLVDNILLAQKQVDEGDNEVIKAGFTDHHVAFLVVDVFLAGIETTKSTLDWVVLTLATRQDVQKKIHEEIDAVIGDEMPGRDRKVDLVYTEATIMEIMRMFPVTPMGFPHQPQVDTEVCGFQVPARTAVMVNQLAIHNDPKHWDQPEKFMPERFLEEDGTKLKPRPKSWVPFSVGPRNCIGEFLARANLLYTVVGLFQKLDITLPPGRASPDFTPQNKWVLYSCKPYEVIIRHRKPKNGYVTGN